MTRIKQGFLKPVYKFILTLFFLPIDLEKALYTMATANNDSRTKNNGPYRGIGMGHCSFR